MIGTGASAVQIRLRRLQDEHCRSWYLTDDGFNAAMFPGFATQFARQMATLDLDDYEVVAAATGGRRFARSRGT